MTSNAATVAEYLDSLPPDRREGIEAVRRAINAAIPEGVEEGMQYGAIGWYVPHSVYRWGYHCDPKQPLPYVGLASQKQNMAVYLFCSYVDGATADWFRAEAAAQGVKLDMGKSCVRFKKVSELPLDLIVESIRRIPTAEFIAKYEAALSPAQLKKHKKG